MVSHHNSVSPQNGDTRGGPPPPPLATPLQTCPLKLTSLLSKVLQNQEQMRLNIRKKLKTASLDSRFTDSKNEECTSICSLLKNFET